MINIHPLLGTGIYYLSLHFNSVSRIGILGHIQVFGPCGHEHGHAFAVTVIGLKPFKYVSYFDVSSSIIMLITIDLYSWKDTVGTLPVSRTWKPNPTVSVTSYASHQT